MTTIPAGSYGAVTLAATTAKQVGGSVFGRKSIRVHNKDAAEIYIGTDAAVTAANGMVLAAGEFIDLPLGLDSAGKTNVYAYSTAGTATGAVRWIEVR